MATRIEARWWRTGGSVVIHLALLAALVHTRRLWVAPMKLPGDAHGSRLVLTYLPGRATVSTSVPVKVAVAKPTPIVKPVPKEVPLPVKTEVAASTAAPVTGTADGKAGDDALGSGDVNIALAQSFPAPKPDLSKLPRGTSGDVVLDVVIGADGKIASMTTTKGLGFGVDEVVVTTVQQWVFAPATKDGKPIASEQELRFHYERG
jgi:protein TonB